MRRSAGDLQGFNKATINNDFYHTLSTKSSNKGYAKNFPSSWNARIGVPISTYNEKVYPKYKILFDHL